MKRYLFIDKSGFIASIIAKSLQEAWEKLDPREYSFVGSEPID